MKIVILFYLLMMTICGMGMAMLSLDILFSWGMERSSIYGADVSKESLAIGLLLTFGAFFAASCSLRSYRINEDQL